MAWVKLDDGFFRHTKVVRAGRDARDLYLAGLCSVAANLTDGFIPTEALRQLAADAQVGQPARLAARLVEVGLWETAEGGYAIHDYLIYNPSRERVLATRSVRAELGAKGGKQKASNLLGASQGAARENLLAKSYPVPVPQPVPHASAPTEPRTPETDRGSKTSAIARARDLAVVNGTNGSPQVAILAAAKIAFGHVGGTETERRKQRGWAHELAEAGVTPDEFGALVAEYRRRGWTNPSLKSIAGNLDALRAPYEAGRRPAGRDEARGFEGVREVFADVFDREGA